VTTPDAPLTPEGDDTAIESLDQVLDSADAIADPALAAVVSALRAPGSERELSAEKTMAAAFAARSTPTLVLPLRRRTRSAGMVAALAAVAVVATAGTAAAAASGVLPGPVQHLAHVLVGAPETSGAVTAADDEQGGDEQGDDEQSPSGSPSTEAPSPSTSSTSSDAPSTDSPSPAPSASVTAPGGKATGLCRAWYAQGMAPHGVGLKRQLAELANGEANVVIYCSVVLGLPLPTATPTGSPAPSASATSGHGNRPATPPGQVGKTPKPKPHGSTSSTSPGKSGAAHGKPSPSPTS
jgi:hypothetical protein